MMTTVQYYNEEGELQETSAVGVSFHFDGTCDIEIHYGEKINVSIADLSSIY